jgi:SAM-dependent methyltransferase
LLHLLNESASHDDSTRIYLTEQTTLLYKYVRERWKNVQGSEWFQPEAKNRLTSHLQDLLSEPEQLRYEDVTDLRFSDQSKDVIISCDVLEHVPNYRGALKEFSRVLVPGGRLLLTVPFMDGHEKSLVRARMREDGQIEHFEEPEYHGDPVDPKGVLAFYTFAWDLLDEVKKAGFSQASWCLPWGPSQALFNSLWTLKAVR